MTELTPQDMAAKLSADPFAHSGPVADTLSDPIADTPMTVTLDQLKPYDLNPRVTRNPRYDEIKASIRERGLDSPPAITRRPGETHYIIRNGGNTRLAILRELWSETKDERCFRIPCLFRPWSERGEIVALTGHLAENELHGGLSFIERALGVEKTRELYEQESGETLTQTELARRLSADGYPITQPLISRMQDAVGYLLPAIPTLLYGGLGRPQIERLTALRKASERIWATHSESQCLEIDFAVLFHEVLVLFDTDTDSFSVTRVQDELIGRMAEILGADYDTLTLDIADESPQRITRLIRDAMSFESPPRSEPGGDNPAPAALPPSPRASGATSPVSAATAPSRPEPAPRHTAASAALSPAPAPPAAQVLPPDTRDHGQDQDNDEDRDGDSHQDGGPGEQHERLQGHIVSPAPTSERVQAIQRLVADRMGDAVPDFEANVLQAIPVQAGGLYPISDVWYIEPGLDTPDRLRVHIAQFAQEMADEAGQADAIEPVDDGIGFRCDRNALSGRAPSLLARAVLALLHALSAGYRPAAEAATPADALDNLRLIDTLGPLLVGPLLVRSLGHGRAHSGDVPVARLSDNGLVKLFRLLRLARRLLEREREAQTGAGADTGTPIEP